jgi:hypothetical protein
MRNVLRSIVPHVTAGAIRVVCMMRSCELRRTMTRQALLPEECDSLFRSGSEVRIVAAGAGHSVSAPSLAGTLRELFHFAHTTAGYTIARVYIEGEIVGDTVARTVVQGRTPRPLDRSITFKMTTDAYRIPLIGLKVGRIDNGSFAASGRMRSSIAMAGLTGDASVLKRHTAKPIQSADVTALNPAHMTAQTTALHWQSGRNFAEIAQAGLHIVSARCGIPGDRRFE